MSFIEEVKDNPILYLLIPFLFVVIIVIGFGMYASTKELKETKVLLYPNIEQECELIGYDLSKEFKGFVTEQKIYKCPDGMIYIW